MKIGIIAHLKHPIRSPFVGGLEAFTHDICMRLKERGHDVTLFASSKSDPELNVHAILNDDCYDDKTGFREKKPNLSSEYMAEHHAYIDLMQHIDHMGLDVIFNNCLHYVPITMSSMTQTPMVTVLHTPPFFELKNAVHLERKHGRMPYVTVSQSNAKNWDEYAGDVKVIQNGIDLNSWVFHAEPTGDYAVWFGRIHPDKGTDLAIKAAELAGIKLLLAGNIADDKYYRTKVEPLLSDNAIYLGHKNHEELNELIGNARLSLITPTWEEPFGLVVAESLACGTPIAGFAAGALPHLVPEQVGALAVPQDVILLAEAIKSAMLKDRSACRDYAVSVFDVDQMVNAYEEMLEEMVSTSGARRSGIYH